MAETADLTFVARQLRGSRENNCSDTRQRSAAQVGEGPLTDPVIFAGTVNRLITDVESFRDELRVQGAMLRRLDAGQTAILEEMRAIRDQVHG